MLIIDDSIKLSMKKMNQHPRSFKDSGTRNCLVSSCQEELKERHQTAILDLIYSSEKARPSSEKLKHKLMSALMLD